jgi:hypothetical protein
MSKINDQELVLTDGSKIQIGDNQEAEFSSDGEIIDLNLPLIAPDSTNTLTLATRGFVDSIAGTSGSSGTSGTSGTSGASGATGNPGTSGTSGTSGSSGSSGVSGSTSGTSGSSGTSGTSATGPSAGVAPISGAVYTNSNTASVTIPTQPDTDYALFVNAAIPDGDNGLTPIPGSTGSGSIAIGDNRSNTVDCPTYLVTPSIVTPDYVDSITINFRYRTYRNTPTQGVYYYRTFTWYAYIDGVPYGPFTETPGATTAVQSVSETISGLTPQVHTVYITGCGANGKGNPTWGTPTGKPVSQWIGGIRLLGGTVNRTYSSYFCGSCISIIANPASTLSFSNTCPAFCVGTFPRNHSQQMRIQILSSQYSFSPPAGAIATSNYRVTVQHDYTISASTPHFIAAAYGIYAGSGIPTSSCATPNPSGILRDFYVRGISGSPGYASASNVQCHFYGLTGDNLIVMVGTTDPDIIGATVYGTASLFYRIDWAEPQREYLVYPTIAEASYNQLQWDSYDYTTQEPDIPQDNFTLFPYNKSTTGFDVRVDPAPVGGYIRIDWFIQEYNDLLVGPYPPTPVP